MAAKKQSATIKALLANAKKEFGEGLVRTLGDDPPTRIASISTGSIGLDRAIGIGGIPQGRVIEIMGPESAGKTTIASLIAGNAQRMGMAVAYIDAEHAFDRQYAEALGVTANDLLFVQPDCAEQALDVLHHFAGSGEVGLVVVDSVASLVPKAELDGDMDQQQMGLQARIMGKGLRKLSGLASKSNCTVVFINQIRMKVGVMFGSPETTPGGMALKFAASVRLDVRRIQTLKDGPTPIGSRVKVKVIKNKIAPPAREAEFDLLYGRGIDWASELLDLGSDLGVLEKSGHSFSFEGLVLGKGRRQACEFLCNDLKVAGAIREEILKK